MRTLKAIILFMMLAAGNLFAVNYYYNGAGFDESYANGVYTWDGTYTNGSKSYFNVSGYYLQKSTSNNWDLMYGIGTPVTYHNTNTLPDVGLWFTNPPSLTAGTITRLAGIQVVEGQILNRTNTPMSQLYSASNVTVDVAVPSDGVSYLWGLWNVGTNTISFTNSAHLTLSKTTSLAANECIALRYDAISKWIEAYRNESPYNMNSQLVITCGDTNIPSGYYDLQQNGLVLTGSTAADKWIQWGDNGTNKWSAGTYRNEDGKYWYLYSIKSELPVLTVSSSGRGGWLHPDSGIDYHGQMTGTNEVDWGGTTEGAQTYMFKVSIVTTNGINDTWTWCRSADMGVTYFCYGPTQNCTSAAVTLTNGVTVAFATTNGHSLSDEWTKVAWSQLPVASFEIRPRRFQEILIGTDWHSATDTYWDASYDLNSGENEYDVLSSTNASILCGSKAPVNNFFFNVLSPGVGITLVTEYWNGSAWVQMTLATNTYVDKTYNLATLDDIQYEIASTTQKKMTPAGKGTEYNLHWYRFRTSTTPTTPATIDLISPHGSKRLAVYRGMLSRVPSLLVDADGNTYVERAYQTDTNSAFSPYQLVTEQRIQSLLKQTVGTYYYPLTNLFLSTTTAEELSSVSATYSWSYTNAVVALATNYGNIYVITNPIGATSIAAGTRYSLNNYVTAYGGNNFSGVEAFQILEWNTTVTNILGQSPNSLAIPNNSSAKSSIFLSYVAPTNINVAATNYIGYRPVFIETGNKAGTWIRWFGGIYDVNFAVR